MFNVQHLQKSTIQHSTHLTNSAISLTSLDLSLQLFKHIKALQRLKCIAKIYTRSNNDIQSLLHWQLLAQALITLVHSNAGLSGLFVCFLFFTFQEVDYFSPFPCIKWM